MNPYTTEVLEYVSFNMIYPFSILFFIDTMKSSSFHLNPQTWQKNTPGKIIIVYDEDERIASQAATAMCERGFENLFMLCGGEL